MNTPPADILLTHLRVRLTFLFIYKKNKIRKYFILLIDLFSNTSVTLRITTYLNIFIISLI